MRVFVPVSIGVAMVVALGLVALAACSRALERVDGGHAVEPNAGAWTEARAPAPSATVLDPEMIVPSSGASEAFAGIRNFFTLSETLCTGSEPTGDAAFAALAARGIKTILSVDGATPDVESARAHGLRYVHLPIGYDGIAAETARRIVKAVRLVETPVFIHCHLGRHRGPTAAALARIGVDAVPVATALAEMRRAGTATKYLGLYDVVARFVAPTAEQLRAVSDATPEVTAPQGLVAVMVAIGRRWEALERVRDAGWRTPGDHPDLVPEREAVQLMELFAELVRVPGADTPADARFSRHMLAARDRAMALAQSLAAENTSEALRAFERHEERFERLDQRCQSCHDAYRD